MDDEKRRRLERLVDYCRRFEESVVEVRGCGTNSQGEPWVRDPHAVMAAAEVADAIEAALKEVPK